MKRLDVNYYINTLDACEGLISVQKVVDDRAIYYIDLCNNQGYAVLNDGRETFEYYCDDEQQFDDLCMMVL